LFYEHLHAFRWFHLNAICSNSARMPGQDISASLRRVMVVTVTCNSAGVIGDFLAAVPPDLAVVVVDNASRDASATIAEAAGARVLRNARNLGFGAACNLGAAAATTEFVLFANPDARLPAEAVAELVAAADAFYQAAILAPVVHTEGRPERSWDAGQFRRRRLPSDRSAEPWPEGPMCVEFASGACLLVRRAASLRFDESFFLYYEDDDLCIEARRCGSSVVLVPTAVVNHAGAASSTPSVRLMTIKAWHMAWSRLRFAHKHAGEVMARREAREELLRHAGKAMRNVATMKRAALYGDLAAFAGTLAWLCGRRGPSISHQPVADPANRSR
jgi:N-acetylglucosaminyl-diphospho-decaprenol L-rhamnosyltransferase